MDFKDYLVDFFYFAYHFLVFCLMGLILFGLIPRQEARIAELEKDCLNLQAQVRAHENLILYVEKKHGRSYTTTPF